MIEIGGGNWDGNMWVLAMVEEEKLDNHFSKHVPHLI